MIIYSIMMLLCLILYFFQNKIRKVDIAYIAMIVLFFLVSALRYNVGQDYQHWIQVYDWIENGYAGGNYVEIGFKALNQIIQSVPFFNVYVLYVITSAFIIFGFGYTIFKHVNKKYWFLALFMFIGSGIFFATLNLVRQYISIVIIMIALPLLIDKKYIKFGLCVVIAGLFHTSSFIMIAFAIFYIIFREQKYKKALIVLYILSLIFMIIDLRQIMEWFVFMIPQRWKWYFTSKFLTDRNYSALVKQIVPNIILLFTLWKRNQILEKKPENDIYILMLFTNVVITNCFYGVLVLLRLSYFFDVSLIFIVPIVIEVVKEYKNTKLTTLTIMAIILYYMLLTIVTIFIMGGHGVMPYQTLFSM